MDTSASAPCSVPERRKRRRYSCPYCDVSLAKSSFYEHVHACSKKPAGDDSMSDSPFELSSDEDDLRILEHHMEDTSTPSYSNDCDVSDEDTTPNFDWSSDSENDLDMNDKDGPVWLDDDDDDEEDERDLPNRTRMPPAVHLLIMFLLIWQCLFHVSDAGLAMLILFVHNFLHLLSSLSNSHLLHEIAVGSPRSLYSARKLLGLLDEKFVRFVVCPKCNSIYTYEQCVESTSSGMKRSKHCWYIKFPNHPRRANRVQCGALLLQAIHSRSGQVGLRAKKVFCYRPLKESLTDLYNRPNFVEMCQYWRARHIPEDIMGDVYDAKVWQEFVGVDGTRFVDDENSLMLFLNVDWFQPFTHLTDSVGAMYLSIQNLPRSERYKVENIILLGIIPGPKEPKLTINSFLSHFVDELKQFWHGIDIRINSSSRTLTIKLALTGISCDLPAVRKVCGFPGHSAHLGCSKCLHRFQSTSFAQKLDYSGYDREHWPPRLLTTHKENANKYDMARTKAQHDEIVLEYGVRSSQLLRLPYFDPIRFHVVDPMHNLLLGTAKRMMSLWIERGLLDKKSLEIVEKRVSAIHTPKYIGRIPTKISSSFAGFTADQWRNWTVIFSPIALKGVLPQEYFKHWILFVKACSQLCTRILRKSAMVSADLFLLQFCKTFQTLYGKEECTPNMHLHLHLKDSLIDYGPVYSFWCFSFERYNGILGSYHTNNRQVEPQIMLKFLNDQTARSMELPSNLAHMKHLLPQQHDVGSLNEASCTGDSVLNLFTLCSSCLPHTVDFSIDPAVEKLIPPKTEQVMTNDSFTKLGKLYAGLYPQHRIQQVQRSYLHSRRASIGGELFVASTFNKRLSLINAYWPGTGENVSMFDSALKRVGTIDYFLRHSGNWFECNCK